MEEKTGKWVLDVEPKGFSLDLGELRLPESLLHYEGDGVVAVPLVGVWLSRKEARELISELVLGLMDEEARKKVKELEQGGD